MVGNYEYDAFGNITNTLSSIADINPFQYKGYYQDVETGLYYCNTRYYNPLWCRWISPDTIDYLDYESINGLNLYAYCGYDPVNRYDPSGHFAISAILIGLGAGFLGTVFSDLIDDGIVFNGSQDWKDYIGNTLAGGMGGLSGAIGLNLFGDIFFSFAGDTIGGLISGEINSWSSFFQTTMFSVVSTGLSSCFSNTVSDLFGKAQYKKIRGSAKKNIQVNKIIKNLSKQYRRAGVTSLKIGADSMDVFLEKLSRTTSNVVITELAGNFIILPLEALQ